MARKSRIHFPGALYHVIARANQRQNIFLHTEDYKTYISYLAEYKAKYNFRLYAYALMTNHIHLLLEVGETALSKLMQIAISCLRNCSHVTVMYIVSETKEHLQPSQKPSAHITY